MLVYKNMSTKKTIPFKTHLHVNVYKCVKKLKTN